MADCKNLDLAREWAEMVRVGRTVGPNAAKISAAADLISSLPDERVDADKLREVIKRLRHKGESPVTPTELGRVYLRCAEAMESLLPAPPAPRTMDEIEWDDDEHHLAEATAAWTEGHPSNVVMLNKFGKKITVYQSAPHYSGLRELNPGILTPTGRKYRLEPEDDTRTGTESENVSHGQPEPQLGEAWLIDIDGEQAVALLGKVDPADDEPTWFTDDGGGYSCDWGNPVARLVPETTKQDTETVFDPAYTYRDKDGDTWEFLNHNWRCSDYVRDATNYLTPPAKYGPYTRIEA